MKEISPKIYVMSSIVVEPEELTTDEWIELIKEVVSNNRNLIREFPQAIKIEELDQENPMANLYVLPICRLGAPNYLNLCETGVFYIGFAKISFEDLQQILTADPKIGKAVLNAIEAGLSRLISSMESRTDWLRGKKTAVSGLNNRISR